MELTLPALVGGTVTFSCLPSLTTSEDKHILVRSSAMFAAEILEEIEKNEFQQQYNSLLICSIEATCGSTGTQPVEGEAYLRVALFLA